MMRGEAKHGGESGFAIIYIIISIVIVSIIGAAITRISSSSVLSEVELAQLNNARYLAESGIQYAQGLAANYKKQSKTIAETVAALNQNSGTVTVPGAGTFTLVAAQSGANILVTSTGRVKSGLANHQLPLTMSIVYGTSASTSEALKGVYSGASASISGNYIGNFATASPILNGGAVVQGSLIYLNTTSCLNISGSVTIGTVGGNDYLCSDACITMTGGPTINGNVYAQGNVTIIGGTVNGNIYSGGNVTLDWGAKVNGNIYTHGTFTQPQYYTAFKGTVYYNAAVPSMCTNYTLPDHEHVASSTALSVDWSGPNTSTYTFVGSPDINDHSKAFSSIYSAGGTKICFDISPPNTYLNIFNSGNMSINGLLYVKTSPATTCFDSANLVNNVNFANYAYASKIYMDVLGTVYFSGGSNWFGTVYAGGDISFGGGEADIGAFYTNQNFNPSNAGGLTSRFVASDYVNKYWP